MPAAGSDVRLFSVSVTPQRAPSLSADGDLAERVDACVIALFKIEGPGDVIIIAVRHPREDDYH